jgi:hypothetical protein
MGGDFPLVTAEGHFVLDVIFTTPIANAGGYHSLICVFCETEFQRQMVLRSLECLNKLHAA